MMRWSLLILALTALPAFAAAYMAGAFQRSAQSGGTQRPGNALALPEADTDGEVAVEAVLAARRSIREFDTRKTLPIKQLGQLLWAAQGKSDPRGLRTAPSAGATYPIECYAVVGRVEGLEPGVYRYRPARHDIEHHLGGDHRRALAAAALNQAWLADAPIVLVIAAVYERTEQRYGDRARRYVHMEAGHVGQNVALQAVALELGTTMVGAFDDDRIARLLELPPDHAPLYIIPIGHPAGPNP